MNTEQEAPRPRSALQGMGVRLSVRLHLHAVGFALLLVPIAMASVFCFPQYLCVECPLPPSHTCAHIYTHTFGYELVQDGQRCPRDRQTGEQEGAGISLCVG